MFTYFLSENGMSRLWKKIPTKQELFNGKKIIFSADTGLLSSLGARSSMKVSQGSRLKRMRIFVFFLFIFDLLKGQ